MPSAIWFALGGAIGSAARYGLAGAVNHGSDPWGTVTVNVPGALAMTAANVCGRSTGARSGES